IRDKGGNSYRITHMTKAKRERVGQLPESIKYSEVSDSFVQMMSINRQAPFSMKYKIRPIFPEQAKALYLAIITVRSVLRLG
ncbi:hypothetical protein PHYSODRAFT_496326, partial [Phytophthora sojae]